MKVHPKSPLLGWNMKNAEEPEDLSIDTVTGEMAKENERTPIKIRGKHGQANQAFDDRDSFLKHRETSGGLIPNKSVVSSVKQANQIAFVSGKA